MFGHPIAVCPFIECNNCGGSGHWGRNCSNEKNAFRKTSVVPEEKNVISIDYNHASSSPSKPEVQPVLTSKPLMIHFYETLLARGRNPELAQQMMLYWRLADHNEASLKNLFLQNSSCSRDSLRLILVNELANAPSKCRPMDVTASDLLDATVDYFMPTSVGDVDIIAESYTRQSSLGPKFSLPLGLEGLSSSGSGFEGRLKSLQPLKEFIAGKMRSLSGIVQVQESYIAEVSTSITEMLAQVELCLFTLRRHFTTFGKESLSTLIEDRMSMSTTTLPERVSSAYVVAIVTDFLSDYCK